MNNPSKLFSDIRNRGYVVLKSFVNLDCIDNVLQDIAKIFQQKSFEPHSFSKALINEFNHNNDRYRAKLKCVRSLMSMIRLSDSFQASLFADNKSWVTQLSAWPNLHLQHPEITFKNGYDRLPPHQEYNYSRGSIDSLVAWMPLFTSSEEHFPIEIIEGSHKKGLIPHKLVGANVALDTLDSNDYFDRDFNRLVLHAGDVVLFSSFAIHRTGKNRINEIEYPVRIAANFQLNNLLEQSIISREYQIGDSTIASTERFDPTPFLFRAK